MIKGTRMLMGSQARDYVDMLDSFRRSVHPSRL